jgi:histone H3/H4
VADSKKKIAEDSKSVIVESRIREAIAKNHPDVRFDGEFFEAVSEKALDLANKAAERAKSNGRSTLRPGDL